MALHCIIGGLKYFFVLYLRAYTFLRGTNVDGFVFGEGFQQVSTSFDLEDVMSFL